MERSKWRNAVDLAAVALIVVLLYATGYLALRMRYVDMVKYPGDGVAYRSHALMSKPDGMIGKVTDFYRPVFYLEAKWHRSEMVTINGWAKGMRMWDSPF